MLKNNFIKISTVFFLFLICFFQVANAADLSIEVNSTQVKVGDTVTATVYVNSDNQSINNIDGSISVSSDILEIQSVSNSGSILNLWVEQPSYSKNLVDFNGGVPNPGYSGSKGKIVSIFMKAVKAGNAQISFNSASVRANDGLGTDVLKNKSGKTINVLSNVIQPVQNPEIEETVTNQISTPAAPVIKSLETPDSNKWYSVEKTNFSWSLPNNVFAVRTLFDKKPDTSPSVVYNPAIKNKTLEDLQDGVWYFHIQYQNEAGWGKVTHRKIQIDNTEPKETNLQYNISDLGLVDLVLEGSDATSDISKFVISTNDFSDIVIDEISETGKAKTTFPTDYFGLKEIKVKTFDSAGNISESNITIDFPKISKPEIINYPKSINYGEEFIIEGKSSKPNSEAVIYIENKNGETLNYKKTTNSLGEFSFAIGSLDMRGKIQVRVEVGSISSDKIEFEIISEKYLEWGKKIINALSIFVPIISIILLLAAIIYLVFKKLIFANKKEKERKRKIKKIEKETIHIIDTLKENVLEDIHLFKVDKSIHDIDEAEKVLLNNLLKDFKNISLVINRRIQRKKKIEILNREDVE